MPVVCLDAHHLKTATTTMPMTTDRIAGQRAALRLAEAEAHQELCRDTETQHLQKLADFFSKRGRQSMDDFIEMSTDDCFEDEDLVNTLIKNLSDPENDDHTDREFLIKGLHIMLAANPNRPAELHRQARVLRGYRRRAEGCRRWALTQWLEDCCT